MSYTTFPRELHDHTKEPMFFGHNVNVARYDRVKYPIIDSMTERQNAFFWRPQEIDISRDRQDFMQKLDAAGQHIFTSNLKYQTLLDSIQGRSLLLSLLKVISIPELENWVETWSFSETIHSRSYTHIIRNLVPDPGVIFDDIIENKYISQRAEGITLMYDKFIVMAEYYIIHKERIDSLDMDTRINVLCSAEFKSGHISSYNTDEITFSRRILYETLFLLLVDIYALESLRFFVSFACSFAFAERKLMEGNAKIIRLILRDEMLHKESTAYIINLLRNGFEGPVWKSIADKMMSMVPKIFWSVVQQESDWGKYLFKDGTMIGLNYDILLKYMKYRAYESMIDIGVTKDVLIAEGFDVHVDPLPWMKTYIESDNVQVAPQEAELGNYLTADVSNDLGSDLDIELVI